MKIIFAADELEAARTNRPPQKMRCGPVGKKIGGGHWWPKGRFSVVLARLGDLQTADLPVNRWIMMGLKRPVWAGSRSLED